MCNVFTWRTGSPSVARPWEDIHQKNQDPHKVLRGKSGSLGWKVKGQGLGAPLPLCWLGQIWERSALPWRDSSQILVLSICARDPWERWHEDILSVTSCRGPRRGRLKFLTLAPPLAYRDKLWEGRIVKELKLTLFSVFNSVNMFHVVLSMLFAANVFRWLGCCCCLFFLF